MKTEFFKYQGAGNDFVILDNRDGKFPVRDHELIRRICDRRFGVGADGLMLLESSEKADFKMIYYNADGFQGSMCGNGGRCIVAFAKSLGLFDSQASFEANGDVYSAFLEKEGVSLRMQDVQSLELHETHVFLDTGSPHHVAFAEDLGNVDVVTQGRSIRYGEPYGKSGTNVNFVEQIGESTFEVRTYERGVEDETLSCGTGVTAVALAGHFLKKTNSQKVNVKTRGGDLKVEFQFDGDRFHDIILTGPATFVYKGIIEVY